MLHTYFIVVNSSRSTQQVSSNRPSKFVIILKQREVERDRDRDREREREREQRRLVVTLNFDGGLHH